MQHLNDKKTSIGSRMREARLQNGYSQAKAAAMVEVSERSYKSYELGRREPSLSALINFCERFESEIDWLVWGIQTKPKRLEMEGTRQNCSKIYALLISRNLCITPEKFDQLTKLAIEASLANETSASEEALKLLPLIEVDSERD